MTLQLLKQNFSICKLASPAQADLTQEFVFLHVTDEEVSLVCQTAHTPNGVVAADTGWKALRVSGILDFGLIGVLSSITNVLAGAGVSVFALSTYNTDYLLVKAASLEAGIKALVGNGYTVER